MARDQHILDIAFKVASENFKNEKFSFKQLSDKIGTQINEDEIGKLYCEMLGSYHFVYCGQNEWLLKDFASFDDVHKFQHALYDLHIGDEATADKNPSLDIKEAKIDDLSNETDNEQIDE